MSREQEGEIIFFPLQPRSIFSRSGDQAKGVISNLEEQRLILGVDYCAEAPNLEDISKVGSDHLTNCYVCIRRFMVFQAGMEGWEPMPASLARKMMFVVAQEMIWEKESHNPAESQAFWAAVAEDRELERLLAAMLAALLCFTPALRREKVELGRRFRALYLEGQLSDEFLQPSPSIS